MECNFINAIALILLIGLSSCGTIDDYDSLYPLDKEASAVFFLYEWGYPGESDGNLRDPSCIASDSNDYIYIVDTGNNRIQKFDSSGRFITKWGSKGTATGQFNQPEGIVIDSSNNVYVTDTKNSRIQKFDSSGVYITGWGTNGSGNSQFKNPWGITCDSSNNIYVTDLLNHRIQKFDSSGTYIMQFGSQGSANGQLYTPEGIAVDSQGSIYVGDSVFDHMESGFITDYPVYSGRIQKFDSSGNYISTWTEEFEDKLSLYIDSKDNIYVTVGFDDSVQIFDLNGKNINGWGSFGCIYYDLDDYNWDYYTDNISYFTESRAKYGNNRGYFLTPGQITILSNGFIYVIDSGNYRVQVFQLIENYWGTKK